MPSRIVGLEVNQNNYSPLTGFVYIFNLIVGTGALTLPGAFSRAGWGLGVGFILVLAFISYITVTFVIESMSISNALLVAKKEERESVTESESESETRSLSGSSRRIRNERDPLIPPGFRNRPSQSSITNISHYEIKQRVELGRMASMYFNRLGLYLFYICIAIYLYGDLAIYITAVSKSLRDVSCTFNGTGISNSSEVGNSTSLKDSDFCWSEDDGMTRFGAYRLYAVLFLVLLGPFCFFNVSKTKYLQLLTSFMRWTAFLTMIGIASKRLIDGEGSGSPVVANVSALPNLFGICVYSFMCHHSLPSLITPIKTKKSIYALFTADYLLITVFYLCLSLTGIFAFSEIQDLYTLNFEPSQLHSTSIISLILSYFLSLFPVFTLSTSFPIIAITLRNNLKALFRVVDEEDEERGSRSGYRTHPTSVQQVPPPPPSLFSKLLSKGAFPILAIIPPFLVAILVEDVQILVGITGSYAGAGIQYIIPALLVYGARKRLNNVDKSPYASPFRHILWIYFVLTWAVISISFVTIHRFIDSSPTPSTSS